MADLAELEAAEAFVAQMQRDFSFFAPRALKIRDKAGRIRPLILNQAQSLIHDRLEAQKKRTGKVRALCLKGRQMGVSTYIDARHFHRVAMTPGLKAVILTHLQDATDNLFSMASRYYENMPEELKIPLLAANAKELRFGGGMDSGYAVATAGSKAVGRSHTAQLFHGSECAFWPNAREHMAGIGQIIPNEPGTEIILESTANGYDPMFHPMWEAAERGQSDYEAIFTPWFMDHGYRIEPPRGYEFTSDDREYQQMHRIDDAQLYWRRRKLDDDLMGDLLLFAQEYPATAAEAFVAFTDSLIAAIHVLRARKALPGAYEAIGPKLAGVDPARYGDDSTAWVDRIGRVCSKAERHYGLSTMETANMVMRRIVEEQYDAVFIDIVGVGAGVYDRCVEAGFGHVVRGVTGSERSATPERHFNKRAECWAAMKDWLENGAKIPDQDDFQADILAPKYTYEGGNRLKIESKDQMRARGVASPDLADALALTFAEPVFPTNKDDDVKRERRRDKTRRPGWRVN